MSTNRPGAALLALALAACSARSGSSSAGIDLADTVAVDGARLALRVRGDDPALPVLLVLHGGPGYAMIDLLHTHVPELERDFVVATFDQRGAGLSYADDLDPATLTLDQLVDDADAVRRHVLDRLERPDDTDVYVLGHSMGTMIGLELVRRHADRYAGYVGVGQVVQVAANEQGSYDFALAEARAAGNAEAVDALTCVGRPTDDFAYPDPDDPDCPDADGFAVTNEWVGYFGGDVHGAHDDGAVEAEILASPAYAGREDGWEAGLDFSAHLFDDPAVLAWDARALDLPDVPLWFFMGRYDEDTPAPLVEAFAAGLDGPHQLVWFERSAHFPFFEEPERFAEQLRAVAAP
jgi:pimeloyl-ACP methyl ester carboxylesterase